MIWNIAFGGTELEMEISQSRLQGHFRGPGGAPLSNVPDEVRRQLSEPLNAPPLSQALVPGDHVAIALDSDLPESERIVVPLLQQLLTAGVAAIDITIVATPTEDATYLNQLIDEIPEELEDVVIVTHNPEDADSLAYLASTQNGRRIYLNRRITDADTFLVVGRAGFDPVMGHSGTASYLFPALSNSEACEQSRILAMDARDSAVGLRQRQICDEVGWLLGLFYGIAVALDRDNACEEVWVGQFRSVQEAAEAHSQRVWSLSAPPTLPSLVVASVSRSRAPSGWPELASALESAVRLAGPETKILLISDLDQPVGPTGQLLIDSDNPWDVMAQVRTAKEKDSLATATIAAALAANRIHLYSRLQPDLVESLSMVPVSSTREIENLIAHSESCFILEDADRVHVERLANLG